MEKTIIILLSSTIALVIASALFAYMMDRAKRQHLNRIEYELFHIKELAKNIEALSKEMQELMNKIDHAQIREAQILLSLYDSLDKTNLNIEKISGTKKSRTSASKPK